MSFVMVSDLFAGFSFLLFVSSSLASPIFHVFFFPFGPLCLKEARMILRVSPGRRVC